MALKKAKTAKENGLHVVSAPSAPKV
ncbi:hypothetical protein tpqmel_0993, partial [Candidatus Gastranaerophilus sp. (ex Termes propinquus)]